MGNASYTAIAFISDYLLKFFKIGLVSIKFNITINFPTLDANVNGGLFNIPSRYPFDFFWLWVLSSIECCSDHSYQTGTP